jgi:hypothetical protein
MLRCGRVTGTARSGLENGEHLSFGNDLVEADKYRFELARGRRSHRDFHLHGFHEGNIVAVADASPNVLRRTVWRTIAPVNGFLLWPQIA